MRLQRVPEGTTMGSDPLAQWIIKQHIFWKRNKPSKHNFECHILFTCCRLVPPLNMRSLLITVPEMDLSGALRSQASGLHHTCHLYSEAMHIGQALVLTLSNQLIPYPSMCISNCTHWGQKKRAKINLSSSTRPSALQWGSSMSLVDVRPASWWFWERQCGCTRPQVSC